jgi:lysophospholipase L1-like esterase
MKESKKWVWGRLALIAGSLLVCSAATELTLRLLAPIRTYVSPLASFHQSDRELGWSGTPNLKAKFKKVDFDVLVCADADGFRQKETTVQPNPRSPVIAVFGDSFAWGWGVGNGQVVTDVMQNRLGTRVDIRNFGVNAYGTVQESLLLKRSLRNGLQPGYVMVMLFKNDFYDNTDRGPGRPYLAVVGTNVTLQNYPVVRRAINPLKKLVKLSYLLSAIAYVADFTKESRHVASLQTSTFQEGRVAEVPRSAMDFALRQFKATCDGAGSRLAFVYVPDYGDVKSRDTADARKVMKDLCEQAGVMLVDLTEGFRQAAGAQPERYYFPHDEHWNAAGHALAGRLLASFVEKEMPALAKQ